MAESPQAPQEYKPVFSGFVGIEPPKGKSGPKIRAHEIIRFGGRRDFVNSNAQYFATKLFMDMWGQPGYRPPLAPPIIGDHVIGYPGLTSADLNQVMALVNYHGAKVYKKEDKWSIYKMLDEALRNADPRIYHAVEDYHARLDADPASPFQKPKAPRGPKDFSKGHCKGFYYVSFTKDTRRGVEHPNIFKYEYVPLKTLRGKAADVLKQSAEVISNGAGYALGFVAAIVPIYAASLGVRGVMRVFGSHTKTADVAKADFLQNINRLSKVLSGDIPPLAAGNANPLPNAGNPPPPPPGGQQGRQPDEGPENGQGPDGGNQNRSGGSGSNNAPPPPPPGGGKNFAPGRGNNNPSTPQPAQAPTHATLQGRNFTHAQSRQSHAARRQHNPFAARHPGRPRRPVRAVNHAAQQQQPPRVAEPVQKPQSRVAHWRAPEPKSKPQNSQTQPVDEPNNKPREVSKSAAQEPVQPAALASNEVPRPRGGDGSYSLPFSGTLGAKKPLSPQEIAAVPPTAGGDGIYANPIADEKQFKANVSAFEKPVKTDGSLIEGSSSAGPSTSVNTHTTRASASIDDTVAQRATGPNKKSPGKSRE
jgi:hypothetical protein